MDDKKQMPVQPLCLSLIEAETEIANAINHAAKELRLPFFLLEPIVANAARQVSELAAAERKKAKNAYFKELEEYARDGVDNG